MRIIDRIIQFNEFLVEIGVARSVVSAVVPRMSVDQVADDGHGAIGLYAALIKNPELLQSTRDLFASGYYSLSVQEAFKVVELAVKQINPSLNAYGTALMETAFSEKAPKILINELKSTSEADEQRGYQRIFSGVMMGIRNPVTHEMNWIDDPENALELIVLAQHLLGKLKLAKSVQST